MRDPIRLVGMSKMEEKQTQGESGGAVRRAMYFSSVTGDKGLHEIEATGEERSR